MMDVNEKAGNRIAFYFITDHSHPKLDGCYHMDEPVIRNLIRHIAKRGHEIGLHGSYNTYLDGTQFRHEADTLRQVLQEEDIHQNTLGGRQHYLRWNTSSTPAHCNDANMNYDSTLSYADRPGFRCGTCHEFPMFNMTSRRPLKLFQRPLILMECSVIDDRYMGLGYRKESLALMQMYKQTCHQFSGNFTLLWHNSHLSTTKDREFYMELIQ
ncbi:polysaccharide deacetylase family protein, partial [bacterium]|nr:polysaccharide deacetylase family protein [bacterium]